MMACAGGMSYDEASEPGPHANGEGLMPSWTTAWLEMEAAAD